MIDKYNKFIYILLLVITLIILVPFAMKMHFYFQRSTIRQNHIDNAYNINERLFYCLHLDYNIRKQKKHIVPWGVSKDELKLLEDRQLLEESLVRLVYGPYTETHQDPVYHHRRDSLFVEYHFNHSDQLYKIVETSGVKYLYVEDNSNLSHAYQGVLSENEAYVETYALFDITRDKEFWVLDDGIFDYTEETLFWKDKQGEEKSSRINDWRSLDEIYNMTGKTISISFEDDNISTNKHYMIIMENDFRVERYYSGKEGTHVTYRQVIKKVSADAVLGEAEFINTLLVD